jgi:hypothetical protein
MKEKAIASLQTNLSSGSCNRVFLSASCTLIPQPPPKQKMVVEEFIFLFS